MTLAVTLGWSAPASAEYAVLRSGQRIRIAGYERVQCSAQAESLCYLLHMNGGRMEIPEAEVVAIEPEDSFGPAAVEMPRTPFDTLIRAISRKEARGLMQLMPDTVRRYGARDVFDPQQNIDAGARYLRELLDKYDRDLPLTLAAYNAGPDRVAQFRGVPPFPETRAYITRVTARLKEFDPLHAAASGAAP